MAVVPRILAYVGVLALGLGGAVVVASPASAATLSVTSTADTGAGTLRQAIADANSTIGPDVISITASGTIALISPLDLIVDDVSIQGPGMSSLAIDGTALASGSGFEASTLPGYAISISGLTLANFPENGLEFQSSDVTIDRVASTGNANHGVLIVDGDLTVTGSSFSANAIAGVRIDMAGAQTISISDSSASDNLGIGLDGNFLAGSAVALTGSHFDRNAMGGGGFYSGNGTTVTITRCSFDGNNPSAGSYAGGLTFYSDGATVTVDDSQFSSNHSVAGGGIQPTLVNGGTASVQNSRITGNVVANGGSGVGGGIYLAAALGATAKFSVSDTLISGNTSDGVGGGIAAQQVGFNAPVVGLEIVRSTIDANSAPNGAGLALDIWSTGATAADPVIYVKDSTISNNTGDDGAAVYAVDSAQSSGSSVIGFQNTTIAGNVGTNGSGGLALIGNGYPTVFVFAHTTIASNTGTAPSGISVQTPDVARILLSHTIVADNTATDIEATAGSQITVDWSLVETADAITATALGTGANNLTGIDPQLGGLAINGGPTWTKLPAASSPVVNAGDPAIAVAPASDQRGLPRLVGTIDLGSVEVQPAATPASPALAATGRHNSPGPALIGLLLVLSGVAMVAFSRLKLTRSLG